MFLEVLKLIAGILLALPAILGVILAIELVRSYLENIRKGRSAPDHDRIRIRTEVAVLIAALSSLVAGSIGVYLVWSAIAAMRG